MKSLIAVIAAIIVLGGAWYGYTNFYTASTNDAASGTNLAGSDAMPVPGSETLVDTVVEGENSADVNAGVTGGAPMSATVTLTATGFSPASVTIKKGGTITFKNEGTGKMWVATAQHPTHTVYAGTSLSEHCDDARDVSFDQCKNGSMYSFTFDKLGTWNYHNHSVNGQYGSVVVVE